MSKEGWGIGPPVLQLQHYVWTCCQTSGLGHKSYVQRYNITEGGFWACPWEKAWANVHLYYFAPTLSYMPTQYLVVTHGLMLMNSGLRFKIKPTL